MAPPYLLSFIFDHLDEVLVPLGRKKRTSPKAGIDKARAPRQTKSVLQLSGNKQPPIPLASLYDLRRGEAGVVDRIDLPTADSRRLMEMGFLPGARVIAGLSAPGGDPKVFQVDGAEVALRGETARRLKVRRAE